MLTPDSLMNSTINTNLGKREDRKLMCVSTPPTPQ